MNILTTQHTIKNNTIELWCETFGKKNNPAIMLIMGNSCDAMMWPDDFCKNLAAHNFYVIRFDQRDTGLSTKIDFATNPYTLSDMALDVIAILNALAIKQAHIVGFSTGGLIAQLLAINHTERVSSLILMMTSPDLTIKNDAFAGKDMSSAWLPAPTKEFINAISAINAKSAPTNEEKIIQLVDNFSLANGTKAPFDRDFFYTLFKNFIERLEADPHKNSSIGHKSNHGLATSITPAINQQQLNSITIPTLIISGDQDPIFPPAHSKTIANAIPHAKLIIIENMGHVITPVFFQKITDAIIQNQLKIFIILSLVISPLVICMEVAPTNQPLEGNQLAKLRYKHNSCDTTPTNIDPCITIKEELTSESPLIHGVCHDYVRLQYIETNLTKKMIGAGWYTHYNALSDYFEKVTDPQKGDLIIYKDTANSPRILHSGIVINPGIIESKWGYNRKILIHPIYHVPMSYGNNVSYYRVIKTKDEITQDMKKKLDAQAPIESKKTKPINLHTVQNNNKKYQTTHMWYFGGALTILLVNLFMLNKKS